MIPTHPYLLNLSEINKCKRESFLVKKDSSNRFKIISRKNQITWNAIIKYTFSKVFNHKKNFIKLIQAMHQEAETNPPFYKEYKKSKQLFIDLKQNHLSYSKALTDEILFLATPRDLYRIEQQADIAVANYFDDLPQQRIFQQYFDLGIASTLHINTKYLLGMGGMPIFSTTCEIKYLENFLKQSLPSHERTKAFVYLADLKRSYNLNKLLYYLDGKKVSTNYWSISTEIHQSIIRLKTDESIHLDICYPYHAMRLQIQKNLEKYEITLIDTSGHLERKIFTHRGTTTLSFQISHEKMLTHGKAYFFYLLKHNSKAEQDSSFAFRNHYRFLKTFKSLGESFTLSNHQSTQKASNCSMQRIRADQKKNLGLALYWKFRKFTLEMIKQEYEKMALDILDGKEIEKLKNLEIKSLDKPELKEAKKLFTKLDCIPINLAEWSSVFKMLNHNIARYSRSLKTFF